jgi:predicted small lipoprotein YifL
MGMRALLLAAAGLALAGCGYKGALTRLEPPDPALTREAQKTARAAERREVEAGLTVPAAARPIRVDELTVKLDVRQDDPFSLPPEGTRTSRKVPFPGEEVDAGARPLPLPAEAAAQPAQPQEH